MQYRSGTNPHEPLSDDKSSRCWVFVLRDASSVRLPEAFVPHTNFVAWDASPGPHFWTLRGYCQWRNPRNYYVLKTRYSKDAEWIPKELTDKRVFEEHTTRHVPKSSYRYIHGVPYGQNPPKVTVPLHKVGYGVVVPDLIQEYQDVLAVQELEGVSEIEPAYEPDDGLVTDDGIHWYDPFKLARSDQKRKDRDSEKFFDFDTDVPLKRSRYANAQFFLGEK